MISRRSVKPVAEAVLRASLTFPDFEGDWEQQELKPFLERYVEKVGVTTSLPIYSSTREGLLPQEEYYGGRLLNDGEYGVVPVGYFVYRHMSDDAVFKFNVNNTGSAIAVSKEYPVFRTIGLEIEFLRYLLNESSAFRQFAAMQRKGGTRTRLYFETLCNWKAPLPGMPEQKKISECLSSIDAKLDEESRNLASLRRQKIGLMQQLLPTAEESQPQVRFPQFQSAGEWTHTNLGSLCSMKAGTYLPASEIEDDAADGLYPCYGGNGPRGYARTFTHDGRYSLVGRQGALCGNVTLVAGKIYATEHAIVADAKSGVDRNWLYYLLDFMNLNQHATGQAQPGLSVTTLQQLPISRPDEDEQQQIADLLSTIDTLIDLQKKKVASLKVHRRGLLQRLFPALEISA